MPAYLDHAATTPMVPAALEAYAVQAASPGNPSSLHTSGRAARAVVEESRERIAASLGARPSEVIFLSGGTEADNLAIKGTVAAQAKANPRRRVVIASAIEHHAVLDSLEFLVDRDEIEVVWLEPDRCGRVVPADLRSVLAERGEEVALVSVMWANNEVGTVQPIVELASLAHSVGVPMHSDAVQAVAHLPVDFAASGLDLMAVTGHKLGGPVGVGALLARRDAKLIPQVHGGGQERQVRSGTLDAAGVSAFAAAVESARSGRDVETKRLIQLRDRLIEGALALDLGIRVSGCWTPGDGESRLAGNAHLLISGCEGDSLLYLLDAAGVECSTGSACSAGVPRPSHVLTAMGYPAEEARGALRVSLGHNSSDADVDAFLRALPPVVERARAAAGRS